MGNIGLRTPSRMSKAVRNDFLKSACRLVPSDSFSCVWQGTGYAVLLRCGIGSRSVFGFEDDDDARRFGFVRPQTRQSRIAPARKTDNFTSLTFHFRRFSGLQHVETAAVEKEGMIPKQVVQLGNRGMAIGKNLGIELAQGLVHLCRV